MNSARNLCLELATRRVVLWQEDKLLRYRAPAGTVTPDLLARLKTHRAELLAITQAITDACLQAGVDPIQLPDELRRDLLAMSDANLQTLAFLIRDHAEWNGWDGGIALRDYAPGGRFYRDDPKPLH